MRACYLFIPTFSPCVHLAVVFGVVVKESCFAIAKLDHAAIVWIIFTIVAEELPTIHVSAMNRVFTFTSRLRVTFVLTQILNFVIQHMKLSSSINHGLLQ